MTTSFFKVFCPLVVLIVGVYSSVVLASSAPPANLESLKQAVEAIREQTGVPAIGIALVDKNGPLWVDALGYANPHQNARATTDTLFRVGSISKMFTAFAVMQLVEEGRLSLDDKLKDWLPELVYENPWRETHPIRVAHLLEHTTGWDVHTGEYAIDVDDTVSLKDALNLHTRARVSRWAPGTRQSYSNTGPVVAARIVEEATGMTFESYAQKAIFTPLQMDNSSFLKTPAFDRLGATGHYLTGPVEYVHIFSRPSSTLHASPKAMANVLTMLIGRGQFNNDVFMADASLFRMENPETTLGSQAGVHAGYGLAMDASGLGNHHTPFFGHTGGVPGFAAELIYQPDLKMGYVFMLNQDNHEAFHKLSNLLRTYLLKDQSQDRVTLKDPLPTKFKQLDGFYTPINPLADFTKIALDITGVIRIETDDTYLYRSPLLGGWRSQDYLPSGQNPDILYSEWSGLPAVVEVVDPISGPALQVEGVLYQKTSAIYVVGRLLLLAISMIAVVGSLVHGLWMLVKWVRKRGVPALKNTYPVMITLLLLSGPAVLYLANVDVKLIFLSVPWVTFIFMITTLYLVSPLLGWWLMIRSSHLSASASRVSLLTLGAHTVLVIYLSAYRLLPLNLWF